MPDWLPIVITPIASLLTLIATFMLQEWARGRQTSQQSQLEAKKLFWNHEFQRYTELEETLSFFIYAAAFIAHTKGTETEAELEFLRRQQEEYRTNETLYQRKFRRFSTGFPRYPDFESHMAAFYSAYAKITQLREKPDPNVKLQFDRESQYYDQLPLLARLILDNTRKALEENAPLPTVEDKGSWWRRVQKRFNKTS